MTHHTNEKLHRNVASVKKNIFYVPVKLTYIWVCRHHSHLPFQSSQKTPRITISKRCVSFCLGGYFVWSLRHPSFTACSRGDGVNLHLRVCMMTCLCNVDPLAPNFHIAKLGLTGVYIIFLFFLLNIEYGYLLELPQSMFLAKFRKISFFHLKIIIFVAVKYHSILYMMRLIVSSGEPLSFSYWTDGEPSYSVERFV